MKGNSPAVRNDITDLRHVQIPGREDRFESALERALELFDLTADDPRWRGHRCQEIMRAREEFCRLFFDPDVPPDSARGLSRYFFGFAWAARAIHYRRQSGD